MENLANLRDLSIEELQTLTGIGRVKAIEIKAMIELGKRINQSHLLLNEQVLGSEKLGRKMIQEIGDKNKSIWLRSISIHKIKSSNRRQYLLEV